jgi:biotin carboxyl carrier protein
LDGEAIPVRVMDELSRALVDFEGKKQNGALEVRAPMSGVVAGVLVAPGETVEPGQAVVVLEAMKMQNELSADSRGIVERIDVSPGDSVSGGALLMTLKPDQSA